MTDRRAFVLLSGGIDSTTALHMALDEFGHQRVHALSVHYGQRHSRERIYAEKTCRQLGVPMDTVGIPEHLLGGAGVMLTDRSVPIPSISYAEIEGVSPTYVPFRNGTMLSLAAARAQKWCSDKNLNDGAAAIYIGTHAEDAHNWAYPDCTPEFIGAMANAIYIGTYRAVRLVAPLMWMRKHEIVRAGEQLGVRWEDTFSCYAGGELHCGVCPTCRARQEAFRRAGVRDPTEYFKMHDERAAGAASG